MFLALVGTLLLGIHGGLCDAATIPPSDGSLAQTLAPLINISLPWVDPSTIPASNDIKIQCRGRQFGMHLSYNSCLDAFGAFPQGHSNVPVKIGRRGTGLYVRNLPWKLVSGK